MVLENVLAAYQFSVSCKKKRIFVVQKCIACMQPVMIVEKIRSVKRVTEKLKKKQQKSLIKPSSL